MTSRCTHPDNMADTRAARPAVTVIVFIFTLCLSSNAQHVKDSSVTCDVHSVEPLANTSVTCHFPENVGQRRGVVTVSFYKGKNWRDERDILECWWLSEKMECSVRPGYKFNRMISHELTLEIPRISTNHIGQYTCKFSKMNTNDIKRCELKIQLDGKTMCDVPSVPLSSRTSLACFFPEDLNKTKADFSVYYYSSRTDPGPVMACGWKGDNLDCSTIRGYEFDRTVTDHLTLVIPHAREDQEGTYSCHFTSTASVHYDNCSLFLEKAPAVTSSCTVSSTKETKPASLTCTFNVDVNATKSNFSLIRIGGVDSKGVAIVNCTWVKDKLKCTTSPGYKFNNTVTDHAIIRVPQVSRDHNGTYSCQVKGSDLTGFKPCEFLVMPAWQDVTGSTTVIIGVLVPLAIIVVFIGIVIAIVKHRHRSICGEIAGPSKRDVQEIDSLSSQKETSLALHPMTSEKVQKENEPLLRKTSSTLQLFMSEEVQKKNEPQLQVTSSALPPLPSEDDLQQTVTKEIQTFWLKWINAVFPEFESRAYFLPPVYINHVPTKEISVVDQEVLVLQSHRQDDQPAVIPSDASQDFVQLSFEDNIDIEDDKAMQRISMCLGKFFKENPEGMVGINQLEFQQYLGNKEQPYYAVAASYLPHLDLDQLQNRNDERGNFGLLLIYKNYGLVVCKMTSLKNILRPDAYNCSLREVISELNKVEKVLSHLVSDIAPDLRISKMIAFPNLKAEQVQQAIKDDQQLIQDLCRCLGTTSDPADITSLCLCCDQLSDPKTPWDVSSHVLRELGHWWQRRVAGVGPDPHMTKEVYKTLVARFCGPATTVSVPCTCPPRVSVKTLGQAVWCTGECYTAVITLFPEQVHLLHTAPPRLYVTGPPGTGKTVVLLLMAIQWLRCGHDVHIVSTWSESRAASIMLYHLLLQTVKTQQSAGEAPGQLHLLQYDLYYAKDVEKAVNDLSQAARGGSLYIIADEVVKYMSQEFQTLCAKLLTRVPRLHLWAASYFHGDTPAGWQVEYLTRPLRSPPAVIREVEQDARIGIHGDVQPYSERGVPDHTDGPPVRRLYHRGQGHSGPWSVNCVTCGREVASFIHSLRVGVTENATTACTTVTSTSRGTTTPCLQWRDVLVISWLDLRDKAGMVKGLEDAGIPVRVMKDDDIENVATARSDVVWVAMGRHVKGLERKVVVCLFDDDTVVSKIFPSRTNVRIYFMSRCTSQLVIVFSDNYPADHRSDEMGSQEDLWY